MNTTNTDTTTTPTETRNPPMTTYHVSNWNEYSTKPENSRLVIKIEIQAWSEKDALHKAAKLAADWNREETRPNMKINMMTCGGFVRNV
jgi:hypothetical protein